MRLLSAPFSIRPGPNPPDLADPGQGLFPVVPIRGPAANPLLAPAAIRCPLPFAGEPEMCMRMRRAPYPL